jgi:hypothetical protein
LAFIQQNHTRQGLSKKLHTSFQPSLCLSEGEGWCGAGRGGGEVEWRGPLAMSVLLFMQALPPLRVDMVLREELQNYSTIMSPVSGSY